MEEIIMKRHCLHDPLGIVFLMAVFYWGIAPPHAGAATAPVTPAPFATIRSTGDADINGWANWANSPPLRKFVDDLPGYCNDKTGALIGGGTGTSTLHQCIPVAVPNTTLYPGSDYYEIEVIQYREQLHSDLPAVVGAKDVPGSTGGTLLRGYRQTFNAGLGLGFANTHPIYTPHYLGPAIVAQKDRPVRIKFTNKLPIDLAGNLFLPIDTSIMGSGPGPDTIRPWIELNVDRTAASPQDSELCRDQPTTCFTQNRADLHLHGGRTPWISDGTPHQWITPAGESTAYDKGVSVAYVPDMWFSSVDGSTIESCSGKTFCSAANATNNPGDGAQTYYYTNGQSARLMFYHDHAWGITRLNVYAGEAAPYIITDAADTALVNVLGPQVAANTIPLVIQDKTFVNANTNSPTDVLKTDPTWIWGSQPGTISPWTVGGGPVTGDLWWPHIYVPAQNPFQMDGANDYGRWHYGPWFFPPATPTYGTKANPYANPALGLANQPPEVPDIPNPSWGAEAFLDTPLINGTAYPKLAVTPNKYRFRILNAAHDRFFNLKFFVADTTNTNPNLGSTGTIHQPGFPAPAVVPTGTEVAMIPATLATAVVANNEGFDWPADGREGGVPDPATRGPAIVQIGNEGGYLPTPVVLLNRPIQWNTDPTLFNVGNVLDQREGGGTLMLGPAERADIIVDFSNFAGKTLILYNDSPAPVPALDPHYDYYTNAPIRSDIGGAPEAYPGAGISTPAGYGPNVRTLMKIEVSGSGGSAPVNDYDTAYVGALTTAFTGTTGIFAKYQEPIIVGQTAYNANYGKTFPTTWPNWGYSRISDTSLSYMTPNGSLVSNYPNEPKAIHDEMNSVFEEYGRLSAKLGLEIGRTNAGTATFTMQNFVDPPTEIVAKDQVQIWKITHNGVDTHPVHFHLFEVQLLNRVAWDGFIRQPDPNEIGWKDTVRMNPLEDTIVALRPLTVPTPFNVPNSVRPLNPAYPLGARDAGFSNLDPVTGNRTTTPTLNEVVNFGHEYVWHCHILSHEESDMMRAVVQNADSLLYTDNGTAGGFWEWNRGDWTQIATTDPTSVVASGTHAYAKMTDGLYEWNGYAWKKISTNPTTMVASTAGLYAYHSGHGIYYWNGSTWTQIHTAAVAAVTNMVASGSGLYADFTGANSGLYYWNGTAWSRINAAHPTSMVASGSGLYADLTGASSGLHYWNGTAWLRINAAHPVNMVASGSYLYATFAGLGVYQWNGTAWTKMNANIPTAMAPSGPDFYAKFTGLNPGLYKWKGNQNWTRISTSTAEGITASGSILFARFTGGGVQKYELGSWSLLLNSTPVTNMVAGF